MARKNLFQLSFFLCFAASTVLAQVRTVELDPPGLNRLPLLFEPNVGQALPDAAFVARGAFPIFLQSDRAVLVLPFNNLQSKNQPTPKVTLQFLHSNKAAQADGLDQLPGKSNYYIGTDSRNWRTGIPQYAAVEFKSVYPGVDLVYYGREGRIEYDLLLSPGADPSLIKFQVMGADRIDLNRSGDLAIQASQGTVEIRKPAIYQTTADGGRRPVPGSFVISGNEVGLQIGDYERDKQLIVDPVLTYSTLIGANNNTTVLGVAVDPSGDMYITGTTFATNYPTVNAFQSKNNGTTNIFVTKLNPAGDTILYSTYLGGSLFDSAAGIAVDSSGSAYITGTASSSNFPTTPGAFMTTCPEVCYTGFVSKFLADGSLAFSTYMGGSNSPSHAIAVDNAGEAYIAGSTASNDLPTTPGSFEPVYPGSMCTSCYNGYVEKLNSSGTALVYSTYFGEVPPSPGSFPSTAGVGIAVDSAGSAYLVGNTTGIPTQNPIQASYVSSSLIPNAFITKFSPDGSTLEYSTYLGGTSPYFFSYAGDYATSVAVDSSGNAHIAGTSSSCDFPLSLSALSTSCVTTEYDQKIFALALNPAGNQILFSTFLESGNSPSIAVDAKGNSYVAGNTASDQFPVLKPIESTSQQSGSTTFVTELNLSGKVQFSTYFGATYGASSAGIAVDDGGGIYIAGEGQGDFPLLNPIPSQILQKTYYTIFASKIDPNKTPQFSLAPRVSPIFAFRNVSSVPLTIDSIVPSSNFSMGGNCGSSLAPGTGCTLILEGADDHRSTGTVTITTNATSKPETLTLSKSPTGDGNVGPLISAFPISLQFQSQLIGTTSPSQKIAVQNSGTQPATITGITLGQPSAFNQTNDCPATLDPSSYCTISVTYTAATADDYNTIGIGLNQMLPVNIPVYGYGASSSIALSTNYVQFGNQSVGAPGVARIINLANTTPVPATAPAVSASAGFAQTNTCAGVLAPNATCRVSVSFTPTGNQNAAGALTATSYGPGGSQIVNLLATGIAAGALELSPVSLNFSTSLGSMETETVTVTNNSQSAVPIASIQTTAPFSQTNTCPLSLAEAASCQVTVTYDPTQVGSSNATLQVSYSGSGSPQTIALTGTAQTLVYFYPTSLQFGSQLVNTTSSELGRGFGK